MRTGEELKRKFISCLYFYGVNYPPPPIVKHKDAFKTATNQLKFVEMKERLLQDLPCLHKVGPVVHCCLRQLDFCFRVVPGEVHHTTD